MLNVLIAHITNFVKSTINFLVFLYSSKTIVSIFLHLFNRYNNNHLFSVSIHRNSDFHGYSFITTIGIRTIKTFTQKYSCYLNNQNQFDQSYVELTFFPFSCFPFAFCFISELLLFPFFSVPFSIALLFLTQSAAVWHGLGTISSSSLDTKSI